MKIQGSLELLLKSGDYNPLLQQIHPLNHKSNDKHGKPSPINNTRKKRIIENRGVNLTPINEILGAKRKKLNDSNVVDQATKDTEDKIMSQNMLLTNNFDWRLSRTMDAGGDDRVDIDKLLDTASECEKSYWSRDAFKLNEMNEHPNKPQTDDSEDIYFY